MKALFIGGTGTISTAIVRRLVNDLGAEVWLLNRGNRKDAVPGGVHQIICDIYNEADASAKLEGMEFDVVSDFIAFDVSAVERDLIGLCVLAVYLVSENSHVIMVPWGRGLWVMCDPQPPSPRDHSLGYACYMF
jgi:NAD(P)-dependent dehydrogenase (short-subunit alcohol dehydrogenase family)